MQELMIHIMDTYGYLGVCFLIAVENLFPPIPSEVILTFGGFMTTYTRLTVFGVVVFSTLGSTIGALILLRFFFRPQELGKIGRASCRERV